MCTRKIISSLPSIRRKNSVIFSAEGRSSTVDQHELVEMLKNNFKREEIEGFYFDENLKNFIVKFTSISSVNRCIDKTYTHIQRNGDVVVLNATVAGDFVHSVKLFNVPCEMSKDMIVEAVGKFGKVINVNNETVGSGDWKITNGNVIVSMTITKEMPIRLEIAGIKIKIFSSSLNKVCFKCGMSDHISGNCDKDERISDDEKSKSQVVENHDQLRVENDAVENSKSIVKKKPNKRKKEKMNERKENGKSEHDSHQKEETSKEETYDSKHKSEIITPDERIRRMLRIIKWQEERDADIR